MIGSMIVTGHDRTVANWAETKFPGLSFASAHSAFGIADPVTGELKGAAVFSDYYPGGNIELTLLAPGLLTRAVLNAISYHAFVTLGVSRVTCRTRQPNVEVIRLLKKAGFKWEGNMRRFYGPDPDDTAVVFSFPVEKAAKWLRRIN